MQVERGEFPHELRVAVQRLDGRREYVGPSGPVHPPVEFDPLGLGYLGREHVPVDRVWQFVRERPVEVSVYRVVRTCKIVVDLLCNEFLAFNDRTVSIDLSCSDITPSGKRSRRYRRHIVSVA